MSLSKRLKSEADKLEILERDRKELPTIRKSRDSLRAKSQNVVAEDRLRQTFQRLSASYDPECSEPASICMQCSENLTENALSFYKETRARGAIVLFQNAIAQAGASKLLKFVLFHIWKNSFASRIRLKNRKKFVAERRHRRSLVIKPFTAWKNFIQLSHVQRKQKEVDRLQVRISELQIQLTKFEEERVRVDQEMESVRQEVLRRDLMLQEKDRQILELHETIAKERSRVIGVSSLTEPIQVFTMLMEEALTNQATSINTGLHIVNASKGSLHDYSHVFDLQIKEMLRQHRERALGQSYSLAHSLRSQTHEEIKMSNKMLLDWINAFSRDASNRLEAVSGKALSKFLPQFVRTQNFQSLKDGKQLSRVIVSLVFDTYDVSQGVAADDVRQPITYEQLEDLRSAHDKPEHLFRYCIAHAQFYLHLPLYRIEDLVGGNESVLKSLSGTLMLMSTPTFHADENKGLQDALNRYHHLSQAFLDVSKELEAQPQLNRVHTAWSTFVGHDGATSTPGSSGGLISRTLAAEANRRPSMKQSLSVENGGLLTRRSITPQSQRGMDNYLDAMEAAKEAVSVFMDTGPTDSNFFTPAKADPIEQSERHLQSNSHRRSVVGNLMDVEGKRRRSRGLDLPALDLTIPGNTSSGALGSEAMGGSVNVDGVVYEARVAALYPPATLGRRYAVLAQSVDDFIVNSANKKLTNCVVRLGRNMRSLCQLRDDFDSMLKNISEGTRLAADVRQYVQIDLLVKLLRGVGWLVDEEPDASPVVEDAAASAKS